MYNTTHATPLPALSCLPLLRAGLAALLLGLWSLATTPARAQIPTGNGQWSISVGYFGSNGNSSLQVGTYKVPAGPTGIGAPNDAYVTSSSSDGGGVTLRNHTGDGLALGHSVSLDGRGIITMTTEGHAFSASLDNSADLVTTYNAYSQFDGDLYLSFTWLPAGGSVTADPPPNYIHVRYKRGVFIDFSRVNAYPGGELVQPNAFIFSHAHANASHITLGPLTANASQLDANYPPGQIFEVVNQQALDDDYVEAVLPVSTMGESEKPV